MSLRAASPMRSTARKSTARTLATGVSLVAALACGACGSSPAPGSGARAHANSSATSSASSSVTDTRTGTGTGSGTGTTSTASLPGAGKPPVTIGDKNYTEQFLLGELYKQALQAQGFTVQLNQNIGPTDVTVQALKAGTLAMYPEYLNLFDRSIAGRTRPFRDQGAAYGAAQSYASAHGLQLLSPTPFSDTDAIGITVGYAEANRLGSLGDLSRVAGALTVGGPAQFQQGSPGLATIERAYGFTAAAFKALAVGDQYPAMDQGLIQAADVGTTDGQLASGDYRLLKDPRRLFGWGNAVPVVSSAAIVAQGPVFGETINRVSALLTTPVMRLLNAAVDVAGQDPGAVAKRFLETHGVIPPTPQ